MHRTAGLQQRDLPVRAFGVGPARGTRGAAAFRILLASVLFAAAGCGEGDGIEGRDYVLEFQVTTAARIGALQLEVTHLGDSGGFIGRGDAVDCDALVDALVASNYDGERTAKIGLINLQGIVTPAPIMRCGFRTRESLSPADFQIQVVDASTPGGDQIDPPPTVRMIVFGASEEIGENEDDEDEDQEVEEGTVAVDGN
jgi:hypothetical protein